MNTVDEFVENLNRLLSRDQASLGNRLINGQFATLEEAKGYAAQIKGLEKAKQQALALLKNRSLADFDGEEALGGLDGSPAIINRGGDYS